MKILLTGANGFLGKVLYSHLISNFSVETLSRFTGDYTVELDKVIPMFRHRFDIVVHAAGLAHVSPKDLVDVDLFYQVNVGGTQNLLRGLERREVPDRIVFISSVAVFGETTGTLINEQTELNAIDPYGKSKIQAEQLVRNWCTVNNVKCTILRLPLVVGLNPPGNLGAMIKGIRKGYYFNIAGGSAKKSMVLASDVAKFLLKASEIGGVFNLTDGYHPSFFELSENLSQQIGKSRSKNLPFWLAKCIARTGDVFGDKAPLNSVKLHKITSVLTFDDSKAREAFGWHPTPVLEGFDISETN
jgi:nucleoside-diphosphate-sugar epimerase